MPMPSKAVVLFDASGAANTLFNTGTIDVSDYDAILIEEVPSAAAAASSISVYDPDVSATFRLGFFATSADANPNNIGAGTGVGGAAAGTYYKGGIPAPLPSRVQVEIGALGVGVTARIRVVGRRNFRGSINRPVASDGLNPTVLD